MKFLDPKCRHLLQNDSSIEDDERWLHLQATEYPASPLFVIIHFQLTGPWLKKVFFFFQINRKSKNTGRSPLQGKVLQV